ncbi:MAG TPA: DUF6599 family protein [Opitutaceae bacterium]|nr:DUF6599 family protein [Opitutaceae bacterium]
MAASALAALAFVLAWVCAQQARFDPAVMIAAAGTAAAPPQPSASLLEKWPDGFSPMGAAETFTPGTLSDKIDGKAELYLSAGFVALRDQRVTLDGGAGSWMEAFIFDMGAPANAFSVFSSQRRPKAADAGIGDYSYEAENELCLVHGRYYVELVCSDSSGRVRRASEALARAYVGGTAVAEHANMAIVGGRAPLAWAAQCVATGLPGMAILVLINGLVLRHYPPGSGGHGPKLA